MLLVVRLLLMLGMWAKPEEARGVRRTVLLGRLLQGVDRGERWECRGVI